MFKIRNKSRVNEDKTREPSSKLFRSQRETKYSYRCPKFMRSHLESSLKSWSWMSLVMKKSKVRDKNIMEYKLRMLFKYQCRSPKP